MEKVKFKPGNEVVFQLRVVRACLEEGEPFEMEIQGGAPGIL